MWLLSANHQSSPRSRSCSTRLLDGRGPYSSLFSAPSSSASSTSSRSGKGMIGVTTSACTSITPRTSRMDFRTRRQATSTIRIIRRSARECTRQAFRPPGADCEGLRARSATHEGPRRRVLRRVAHRPLWTFPRRAPARVRGNPGGRHRAQSVFLGIQGSRSVRRPVSVLFATEFVPLPTGGRARRFQACQAGPCRACRCGGIRRLRHARAGARPCCLLHRA